MYQEHKKNEKKEKENKWNYKIQQMNHNWFANDFIIVVRDFWLESSIITYTIPFFLFVLSFKNSLNLAYARLLRVCYVLNCYYSDLSRIISTKNWKTLAKSAVAKLHCGITKREQYIRFAHEYIQSRRTVYGARLYIYYTHTYTDDHGHQVHGIART